MVDGGMTTNTINLLVNMDVTPVKEGTKKITGAFEVLNRISGRLTMAMLGVGFSGMFLSRQLEDAMDMTSGMVTVSKELRDVNPDLAAELDKTNTKIAEDWVTGMSNASAEGIVFQKNLGDTMQKVGFAGSMISNSVGLVSDAILIWKDRGAIIEAFKKSFGTLKTFMVDKAIPGILVGLGKMKGGFSALKLFITGTAVPIIISGVNWLVAGISGAFAWLMANPIVLLIAAVALLAAAFIFNWGNIREHTAIFLAYMWKGMLSIAEFLEEIWTHVWVGLNDIFNKISAGIITVVVDLLRGMDMVATKGAGGSVFGQLADDLNGVKLKAESLEFQLEKVRNKYDELHFAAEDFIEENKAKIDAAQAGGAGGLGQTTNVSIGNLNMSTSASTMSGTGEDLKRGIMDEANRGI